MRVDRRRIMEVFAVHFDRIAPSTFDEDSRPLDVDNTAFSASNGDETRTCGSHDML
jgi:hypothetical protein